MRVLASSAVALLLGASTGCSAGTAEEEIDVLPFEALRRAELGDGPDEFLVRQVVEQGQAVARCMHEKGFEYYPGPVYDGSEEEEETPEQREDRLRAHGWGMFPADEGPVEWVEPELDEQGRYEASLSPSAREEYHRALFGEPDPTTGQYQELGGCWAEWRFQEDENSPELRFADLLDEVRSAWARAAEEPEVIEARDAYRACLSLAGFPGGGAGELLEQRFAEEFPTGQIPGNDPRLPELVKWEIALANADLDCLEESGASKISARAVARIETQILERRAEEVEAYLQAAKEYYEVD